MFILHTNHRWSCHVWRSTSWRNINTCSCWLFLLSPVFIENHCKIQIDWYWNMKWTWQIELVPGIHNSKDPCSLGRICPYPITKFIKTPHIWCTYTCCSSSILYYAIAFFEWIDFWLHLFHWIHECHATFNVLSIYMLHYISPHSTSEIWKIPVSHVQFFMIL